MRGVLTADIIRNFNGESPTQGESTPASHCRRYKLPSKMKSMTGLIENEKPPAMLEMAEAVLRSANTAGILRYSSISQAATPRARLLMPSVLSPTKTRLHGP